MGGHQGIVSYLSSMDEFDEIRVIPVFQHMFSSKRGKQASYDDRVAMCRLAFEGIPKVNISQAEKECFDQHARKSENYNKNPSSLRVGTADLLDMLILQEPAVDFTLALGSDTFMDLTSFKWRRSRDILNLLNYRLLVFHRQSISYSTESEKSQYESFVNDRIEEVNTMLFQGDEAEQCKSDFLTKNSTLFGARAIKVPELSHISSTIIRSSTNESILTESLHHSVYQYIKRNRLFAFADT